MVNVNINRCRQSVRKIKRREVNIITVENLCILIHGQMSGGIKKKKKKKNHFCYWIIYQNISWSPRHMFDWRTFHRQHLDEWNKFVVSCNIKYRVANFMAKVVWAENGNDLPHHLASRLKSKSKELTNEQIAIEIEWSY